MGTGGHLIRYDGQALLTAPSLTNPHVLRAGPLMPISSCHEQLAPYLPEVSEVSMILVGRAHYDHLPDVAQH